MNRGKHYPGMLKHLQELKYRLPRSERRIADTVLQNPEVVAYMRLNELAHAADVSIATVHRFCRSLNCEGFKELRQEIGRSVAEATSQSVIKQNEDDSVLSPLPIMINEITESMAALETNLDEQALAVATHLINDASRAIIFGLDEAFHSTMQEGSSLLYKAGLPCETQLTETAMDRAVPTLKQNDVAIFLVTSDKPEPNDWLSAVKQMGGNSLAIIFDANNRQPKADVSIALDCRADHKFKLLIAQLSLTLVFTHLSTTLLPR